MSELGCSVRCDPRWLLYVWLVVVFVVFGRFCPAEDFKPGEVDAHAAAEKSNLLCVSVFGHVLVVVRNHCFTV